MGYLFVQIKKWIQELDLYREVHANLLFVKSIGIRYYNYMILYFAKQKTEMEGHSVR